MKKRGSRSFGFKDKQKSSYAERLTSKRHNFFKSMIKNPSSSSAVKFSKRKDIRSNYQFRLTSPKNERINERSLKEQEDSLTAFENSNQDQIPDISDIKLKNLSTLIMTPQFKILSETQQQAFIQLFDYTQSLVSCLIVRNKEIKRLKTLNKYLYQSNKKRDQRIIKSAEENRILVEKLKKHEQVNKNINQKLREICVGQVNFPLTGKIQDNGLLIPSSARRSYFRRLSNKKISSPKLTIKKSQERTLMIYDRDDFGIFFQNSRSDSLEQIKSTKSYSILDNLSSYRNEFYEKVKNMPKTQSDQLFYIVRAVKAELVKSVEIVYDLIDLVNSIQKIIDIGNLHSLYSTLKTVLCKYIEFDRMRLLTYDKNTKKYLALTSNYNILILLGEGDLFETNFDSLFAKGNVTIVKNRNQDNFDKNADSLFNCRVNGYGLFPFFKDRSKKEVIGYLGLARTLEPWKNPTKREELIIKKIVEFSTKIMQIGIKTMHLEDELSSLRKHPEVFYL